MDDVISKTETMKNNLNRQKYEIELLIKKVKDDGEELPPDLLAEFEKAKQNVLEINESIDDINARIKNIEAVDMAPEEPPPNISYTIGIMFSVVLTVIGWTSIIWFAASALGPIAGTIVLIILGIRWIVRKVKDA
jgi:hypothetical protein